MAQGKPAPNDPIVLLLKGIYHPVVNGPDVGLPGVDLNDGTWRTTEIHTVRRVPGSTNQDNAVVGNFYVGHGKAVYDLPGGAILMHFTAGSFGENPPIPDGQGGRFLEATFELTILDATGIYSPYTGGHNHMVDRFHALANGQSDENCYCIISVAGSLPLWWSSHSNSAIDLNVQHARVVFCSPKAERSPADGPDRCLARIEVPSGVTPPT